MENVILIKTEDETTLADLTPNNNFIVDVESTGARYRSIDGVTVKMYDANNIPPVQGITRYVPSTDTLVDTDFIVELDGTFTFNLPTADGPLIGRIFFLNNSGAGTITVDPDSTELIQGLSTFPLLTTKGICITPNAAGTGWLILSAS